MDKQMMSTPVVFVCLSSFFWSASKDDQVRFTNLRVSGLSLAFIESRLTGEGVNFLAIGSGLGVDLSVDEQQFTRAVSCLDMEALGHLDSRYAQGLSLFSNDRLKEARTEVRSVLDTLKSFESGLCGYQILEQIRRRLAYLEKHDHGRKPLEKVSESLLRDRRISDLFNRVPSIRLRLYETGLENFERLIAPVDVPNDVRSDSSMLALLVDEGLTLDDFLKNAQSFSYDWMLLPTDSGQHANLTTWKPSSRKLLCRLFNSSVKPLKPLLPSSLRDEQWVSSWHVKNAMKKAVGVR